MDELIKINFYDDELLAVTDRDGKIYVPLKRIADNIGFRWDNELARIKEDEIFKTCILNFSIQLPGDVQKREMVCIPFEFLAGYLFKIPITQRTRPEVKEKLIRYQLECFPLLQKHFFSPKNQITAPSGFTFHIHGQKEKIELLCRIAETINLQMNHTGCEEPNRPKINPSYEMSLFCYETFISPDGTWNLEALRKYHSFSSQILEVLNQDYKIWFLKRHNLPQNSNLVPNFYGETGSFTLFMARMGHIYRLYSSVANGDYLLFRSKIFDALLPNGRGIENLHLKKPQRPLDLQTYRNNLAVA